MEDTSSVELSNLEDTEWKAILEAQQEEQRQSRRLFTRVRPLLFALCLIVPVRFSIQARARYLLRERVMQHIPLQKLVGARRKKLDQWMRQKKYFARREDAHHVTIIIPNSDIGLKSSWWTSEAVEITATFDSQSKLTNFDQTVPTTISYF